jgi:hypothetical protein
MCAKCYSRKLKGFDYKANPCRYELHSAAVAIRKEYGLDIVVVEIRKEYGPHIIVVKITITKHKEYELQPYVSGQVAFRTSTVSRRLQNMETNF